MSSHLEYSIGGLLESLSWTEVTKLRRLGYSSFYHYSDRVHKAQNGYWAFYGVLSLCNEGPYSNFGLEHIETGGINAGKVGYLVLFFKIYN